MRILFLVCAVAIASLGARAQTNSMAAGSGATPLVTSVTKIRSLHGQFYMKTNYFVYQGDVHVDNPQMQLTCGLLTIDAPKTDEGKFNRATAITNVVIDWVDDKGPNHATSDKAVYTYTITNILKSPEEQWQTNAFVVLTGNPVVTNSQGTFRADPIIWDRINDVITSTNFVNMEVNQSSTNSASFFDTSVPKNGAKTNATPQ